VWPDILATPKIGKGPEARHLEVWPDIPARYFKSGPNNPATLEIG
jgi:hypothetical protein